MTLNRLKLSIMLGAMRKGGSGASALYGAYLDRLPRLFGSNKLAEEADLVLAALAAAEIAHEAALVAVAPIAFERAGEDDNGEPLFRPTSFALVGCTAPNWTGAPLQALALALNRARDRQSIDDEVYSANFVYVLFRLKAALGVWRGDGAPDARYRLWLKDLAPAIATHPRLGPKVAMCHAMIARAVIDAGEFYGVALKTEDNTPQVPAIIRAFATTALHHARAGGVDDEVVAYALASTLWASGSQAEELSRQDWAIAAFSAQLALLGGATVLSERACDDLAAAYMNRGVARASAEGHGSRAAIQDYDKAIAIRERLRRDLDTRDRWKPEYQNHLAGAYMHRGTARASSQHHGPRAAIEDYGKSIALREGLRDNLAPQNRWTPQYRNDLAAAYMNRGNAHLSTQGYGQVSAIKDYDKAIAIWKDWALSDRWIPRVRNDLAAAYMNRGTARASAGVNTPAAAIDDHSMAIAIRESLHDELKPKGRWIPEYRNGLAAAYMNRGNARQSAEDHGRAAAIEDYGKAIAIQEGLREELEPRGEWILRYRDNLATSYMNRGVTRLSAEGHGPAAAIEDYGTAITIQERLRSDLEPLGEWRSEHSHSLATNYFNRGVGRAMSHDRAAACEDARRSLRLVDEGTTKYGSIESARWTRLEKAAKILQDLVCPS